MGDECDAAEPCDAIADEANRRVGSGDDEDGERGGALVGALRRLGSRLPIGGRIASRPIRWLRRTVDQRVTRASHDCDLDAYDVPLDPFRVAHVDPASITRLSRRPFPPDRRARRDFGRVRGGEWDRRSIEETPITSSIPRHLFDGPRLDRTPLYGFLAACVVGGRDPLDHPVGRELADRLVHGQYPVWGDCREPADVRERVRALEAWSGRALKADADGLRSNVGFTQRSRAHSIDGYADERDFLDARANGILVDVARDGELLAAGGLERLCLARLLGIDRVPLAILVRHDRWVAECEWRWLEGEPLGDHPDCAGITAVGPHGPTIESGDDPSDRYPVGPDRGR